MDFTPSRNDHHALFEDGVHERTTLKHTTAADRRVRGIEKSQNRKITEEKYSPTPPLAATARFRLVHEHCDKKPASVL
jgi:hypothetical protein